MARGDRIIGQVESGGTADRETKTATSMLALVHWTIDRALLIYDFFRRSSNLRVLVLSFAEHPVRSFFGYSVSLQL